MISQLAGTVVTGNPIALAAAAIAGFFIFRLLRNLLSSSSLKGIPTVGVPNYPFGFYVGAWNYIKNAPALTQEGYDKYPGGVFKVPLVNQWLVILNGRELSEDLKKAPDDCLSMPSAINSMLHMEYTMGKEQYQDPYHFGVVRNTMTRNIGLGFPDMRDETIAAFQDLLPATDDWSASPAMENVIAIVSRISNRFFVGMKCRDPDYIKVTSEFTIKVTQDTAWLHGLPEFIKPLAESLFGHLETHTTAAMNHLQPILEYRLEMDDKYGPNWPNGDRPNDMISWLIDGARGHPMRRNIRSLSCTMLNVNFGALHTITQGVLHALYTLAAHLQYVEPLREEIESVVEAEGWTKAAIDKMVKLDSFLKESARYEPGTAVNVLRRALKDYTLSNGVTLPAGTLIGLPIMAQQHDEQIYENGDSFDPFRYARMKETAEEGSNIQMTTTSTDFLLFGLGRRACPGRFLAVTELKLIMSHILLNYDFKVKDGVRPDNTWIAVAGSANPTAEVLFRKRR
ncbi:cytochrome P450 [Favolaschia claudopus]|uniref:Cytochrome P450 n=1 Tax=Favolaschia claudopus TaxID=2862362 RepID=A0AAW0CI12_9AGAR